MNEKWFMFKYMFWSVLSFCLIIGNLIAFTVTGNKEFLIISLLWLVVMRQDDGR